MEASCADVCSREQQFRIQSYNLEMSRAFAKTKRCTVSWWLRQREAPQCSPSKSVFSWNSIIALNRIKPSCDQTIHQCLKQTKVGLQKTVSGQASPLQRDRLLDFQLAPGKGCWQVNSHSPITFLSMFSLWPHKFCPAFVRIIHGFHVSTGPQWRTSH